MKNNLLSLYLVFHQDKKVCRFKVLVSLIGVPSQPQPQHTAAQGSYEGLTQVRGHMCLCWWGELGMGGKA